MQSMQNEGATSQGQSQGATAQVQDKAQEAAGQAKDQAKQVAGQAKGQVRSQIDQRSTQAGQQITSQASDIRTVGQQLREQGKEGPAKVADQAADRIERVGSYLTQSDPDRILGDVENVARSKPWTVVAGGLTLGFVASRFLKASQSDRYQTYSQQRTTGGYGGSGYAGGGAAYGTGAGTYAGGGTYAEGGTYDAGTTGTRTPTPGLPATENELSTGVTPSAHPSTPAVPGPGAL